MSSFYSSCNDITIFTSKFNSFSSSFTRVKVRI
uniref:Uncharacterized protein n=1 Tax=Solanum lycopersicum TaxID=4081 RepID=A0A3Q7FL07_SOLLC